MGGAGIPGLQKDGIPRASYLARLVEEKGFWSGNKVENNGQRDQESTLSFNTHVQHVTSRIQTYTCDTSFHICGGKK